MDTGWFVVITSILILYFLPSLMVIGKKKPASIIALNILAGWTLIGWLIAFIWVLEKDYVNSNEVK